MVSSGHTLLVAYLSSMGVVKLAKINSCALIALTNAIIGRIKR